MDYFFLTKDSVETRDSMSKLDFARDPEGDEKLEKAIGDGTIVKCLLLKDMKSKAMFAWVVPNKGRDMTGFVVDQLTTAIKWLGYTNLVLKSDNEPAVLALLRDTLRAIRINVDAAKEEHSMAYDSQANGGVENGIRNLRGMLRSIRCCLEDRLGRRFPVDHPVLAWMVSHAASIMTIRHKGVDGRTAWMRVRGRPFGLRRAGFGELCQFKLPMRGPRALARGNTADRWEKGVFLGYSADANTYVYSNAAGIQTSRCLERLPYPNRWSLEKLAEIKATPSSRHVAAEPGVVLRERPDGVDQPRRADATVKVRKLKITVDDLDRFGFTEGCQQCEYILRYRSGRPGYSHNDTCRKRIIEALMDTVDGRERLARLEERVDRALAEHVEGHAREEDAHHGLDAHHGDREEVLDPHLAEAPRGDSLDEDLSGTQVPESGGRPVPTPADETGEVETQENMGDQMADGVDHGDDDMSMAQAAPATQVAPGRRRFSRLRNSKDDNVANIDDEVVMLVSALGGDGHQYRRERHRAARRMVAEVYSPPRVTEMLKSLPSLRLIPGFALDLTTLDESDGMPWDFRIAEKRRRAAALVTVQKPMLVVGSPSCKEFCSWQALNDYKRDPEEVRRLRVEAELHMNFVAELYKIQHAAGRYFLHEHPWQASSWKLDSMQEVAKLDGVMKVRGDQCQYGAVESKSGDPVRKATGFMTNAPRLAASLSRLCDGQDGACGGVNKGSGRRHRQCEGRVAREAALYPPGLCKAILRGISRQLMDDGVFSAGEVGVQALTVREVIHQLQRDDAYILVSDEAGKPSGVYKDDITGQVLLDSLVKEAQDKELEYFDVKRVWELKPRDEAKQKTGRAPISVRWVITNKGDDGEPNYRARLVARQIRHAGVESIFAPTPPLEGVRLVLSLAATLLDGDDPRGRSETSEYRTQLLLLDISRAYFNAKTDPNKPTYVDLPREHPQHGRMCALLRKHMYGTLQAADGWQEEYSSSLVSMGFVQGVTSPCVFFHPQWRLACAVHGDDFTVRGPKHYLDLFVKELEQLYEFKIGGRLGPGLSDDKEGTILNRVVRWTPRGLEYEADPRQSEKVLYEMDLEDANSVATPGLRPTAAQIAEDTPLEDNKHTMFRGVSARCNYLAADRPDMQHSAKEVCRFMAHPSSLSYAALRRLARYLVGRRRLIYEYDFQTASHLDVYSDTDWAGCPRTRRSTSGGCVMLGSHCLKSWSSTQPSVSLSSGEAEFYGLVKASGIGLGFKSLVRDLGYELPCRVWTDSSAAMGIVGRQGLGKLRHIDTHSLWVQQAARSGRILVRKVRGDQNPADLFTKHLCSREKVTELVRLLGCRYEDGRPKAAPELRRERMTKATLGRSMQTCTQAFGEHDESTAMVMNLVGEAEYGYEELLPHQHSDEEIVKLFPAMPILEAGELGVGEDYIAEAERFDVEKVGDAIAEGIMEQSRAEGRRRHGRHGCADSLLCC